MRKSILVLAVVLVILISGCQGGQQTTQYKSPYIGGTQGVTAAFEPFGVSEQGTAASSGGDQGGIATIFDDETFPVEITLKNKGENDLAAGDVKITLKGVSPNDYEGIAFDKSNANPLEKLSEFNPDGGEETVDFGDAKYKIQLAGSYYQATLFASYQYPYKTHIAVPKVCFSTELKDTTVCEIEGIKDVFSSGAPIQVKAAKETRAGSNLIAMEFDIENVGGGQVRKPTETFDTRYDTISFSLDDTSDPSNWECRIGGEENGGRLTDGKATIRCKLKTAMPDKTMYTKQLDITISYLYKGLIDQSVMIKKKD